eukprot:1859432-Ditylum_brightwellii.AAC.1
MQTGISFKKILRKYNIQSENTEPLHPNQNLAERCIQDVKRTIELLGWVTPYQACFGVTPDISALLQYQFYQPVYFSDKDVFPNSDECLGHWLGVAENK